MGRALLIIALLALNAFFVAVEFALVRARRTRLEALARAGDRLAVIALRATSSEMLPRVLSAGQLGITLASLGLGWAAEEALGHTLAEWFALLPVPMEVGLRASLAAGIALIVATYLHVVFGELAPRASALNHPETAARYLSPPILAFTWLTTPFNFVLNRSADLILRLFGERTTVEEHAVHSPEELRMIVEHSEEGGALQSADAELIEGVFEFSEKNALEVMTPRTDVIALPIESTIDEACTVIEESGFSRYPVYEGSIDNIIGLVIAKDLLLAARQADAPFTLHRVMRDIHVVPGSREVEEVLSDFKRRKEHLAVVLDEFGGTAGIVTMEDLLEEIVGEILDEYDEPEQRASTTTTGDTLIPGETHIAEVNDAYGLSLDVSEYTTLGGYVFGALGRLPAVGDVVQIPGATLTVREMDGRRIRTVSLAALSVAND